MSQMEGVGMNEKRDEIGYGAAVWGLWAADNALEGFASPTGSTLIDVMLVWNSHHSTWVRTDFAEIESTITLHSALPRSGLVYPENGSWSKTAGRYSRQLDSYSGAIEMMDDRVLFF